MLDALLALGAEIDVVTNSKSVVTTGAKAERNAVGEAVADTGHDVEIVVGWADVRRRRRRKHSPAL